MTTSHLSTNVHKYHGRLREAVQQENLEEIGPILYELATVCRTTPMDDPYEPVDRKSTTDKEELKFWLIDVARLMLDSKCASTRRLALTALESAIPHLVKTNYQEQPVWAELRVTISRDYTPLLDTARSDNDPNWHRMWSALVRIMNRDLCQGSSIINMFLSIVEAGFRSPELSIREQSFDCWRLLVQVFADNKQINLPKRTKLICIPLKSSKSKTETIALSKFDIWWFMLNQLRPQLDELADIIFEPFIYFCFGPSFKPPLCYYFDDAYQEYGAPGKIYHAIKQLSAMALIHLLGPAPEVVKTLLVPDDARCKKLPFDFPKNGMAISPLLFSTKAKLLIDACIECTVLFAEMKHLKVLELNRCLWGNLMERIDNEKSVPKNELLQRIKEDTNALLNLCIKREKDVLLRDLFYETLLIIAKSDLLTVTIGYDSPEQLILNYNSFMSNILHPELPCPANKSDEIIRYVFGLQRYTRQCGYWEMLQKTIQYLSATDGDHCISEFRTIRTQIYCHLASYLIIQIRDDRVGFTEHQSTVMSFLLYPLEYDQMLAVDGVKGTWDEVYKPIAFQEMKSCEFTITFCDMIKAMTVAKFTFNLGVVADFVCTILSSLSVEFHSSKPPIKVFELFKDLTRKAQAYQASLKRVEKMVYCFREVLVKMSITNLLTLIMPIRNAINEMVSNEKGLAMDEVKRTLTVIASKIVAPCMLSELPHQPKEVQWNCKMLIKMMLDLPADVKKGWKQADMRKCMDICDGKETNTQSTHTKEDDEFVVIKSVWNFKPEVLTEHQREKMMQKRTDIPALYNDMSQSQDSFVIKPWTPNKRLEAMQQERLSTEIVSSTAENKTEKAGTISENTAEHVQQDSEPVESPAGRDESITESTRPDKENKNENVLTHQSSPVTVKEEVAGSEDDGTEQPEKQRTRSKKRSVLEYLRIDTVEGKSLDVMNLSRTRRSEGPEYKSTRRKSLPLRHVESEKKTRPATKAEERSVSVSKATTKKDHGKVVRSTRKLLNFRSVEDNSEVNGTPPTANTCDDIIESSQTPAPSQSFVGRKISLRKSRVEESTLKPVQTETPTNPVEADKKIQVHISDKNGTSKDVALCDNIDTNSGTDDVTVDKLVPDEHVALKSTPTEMKHVAMRISSLRTTRSSVEARVEPDEDGETLKKEIRSPSSSHRSLSGKVAESSVTPLSPSRRSTHLATDDNAGRVSDLLANNSSNDEISKEIKILLKSPRKSDMIEVKGTPTKMKSFNCTSPVRTALQLLHSPRKNLSGEMESGSAPKVARFSPLVVLEPMKNYPPVGNVEAGLKCNSDPINSVIETQATDPDPTCDSAKPSNVIGDNRSSMLLCIAGSDAAIKYIVKDAEEKMDTSTVTKTGPAEEVTSGLPGTVDQLSPAKNLDEEMEPLNKSMNRSIVSSPDVVDAEERNAELLDSTLNISPISEEQSASVKTPDGAVLAGNGDRRASGSVVGKERDPGSATTETSMSTVTRRNKPSPSAPVQVVGASNPADLKGRSQQKPSSSSSSVIGTPRSPSTTMIGLGGRGAQLINLIRSQHSEQSPKTNIPPQNASTPKGSQAVGSANRLMMRKRAIAASAASATPDTASSCQGEDNPDHAPYLVFSKVLPSPLASPASGILKRQRAANQSGEASKTEDDIESPALKRKRVSFHDPPVSLTKEYIRQEGECRSPSISRCLQLATSMSSADKAKYMMRRRGTSDSISELQNFTKTHDGVQSAEVSATTSSDVQSIAARVAEAEGEEEELTSSPESLDDSQFMIHDATDNMTPLQVTAELMIVNENPGDLESASGPSAELEAPGGFHFSSEEAVLKHVMERYTLDGMLERYLSAGSTLEHGKSVRLVTKELSSMMSKDAKTRHQVLDDLSERHPVEFLEHAIQENSSAMVCERLSLVAMIDHIFKHLHKGYDTARKSGSPSTSVDDKDSDSLRLVQCIYDKLFSLPNIESNSQSLKVLRDRFLREELARLSRLEIMVLLESYFKATSNA